MLQLQLKDLEEWMISHTEPALEYQGSNEASVANECMLIVDRLKAIEEEKTTLATECKVRGIELDKKIGALRIKVTMRNTKLRQSKGSFKAP